MAAYKKLINRTGEKLKVVLVVRKGDHPTQTAGSVDVELTAAPDDSHTQGTPEDASVRTVPYGNKVDIFLNGIEATLMVDGKEIGRRVIVIERGSELDNELNMHDTIEFLYDGNTILFSLSNTA